MNYSYQTLKSGHYITGDDPATPQTGHFDPARWTLCTKSSSTSKSSENPSTTTAYTTKFLK